MDWHTLLMAVNPVCVTPEQFAARWRRQMFYLVVAVAQALSAEKSDGRSRLGLV